MANDLIFVSYSRKEFYFTESLVLHLQKHDIDAWFDVQQLEPGIGWKTDIQDGLEKCKALVLIASQASLASPYVKGEVQAAQSANKPVYIVLFEPITLPPDLNRIASLIDFTQGFERGVPLLVNVIQEQINHHDPMPNLQSHYLPEGVLALKKLLRQRQILLFMLLVSFLFVVQRPIIFLLSEEFRSNSSFDIGLMFFACILTSPALFNVIVNRHIIGLASHLQRRENTPFKHWVKAIDFRFSAFFAFFVLTIAAAFAFKSVLLLFLLLPISYVMVTTILRMTYHNRIQILLNPDVLRWCHLGDEVPYDWRILVNQEVLPDDMEAEVFSKFIKSKNNKSGRASTFEIVTGVSLMVKGAKPIPKTYRLYDAPQIQEVAANIRNILTKNAFQLLQDGAAEPDYHILLLSPWTQIGLTEKLIQDHPQNVLPLLVAPTDLRLFPNVTKLQLIDFRKRYEPQLTSALQYLHTENAEQRSVFSIGVLPIRVSSSFPLYEMRTLQRTLVFTASLCFFGGILGVISLIFLSPINAAFVLRALIYLICLGLAFWLRRNARDVGNLVPQSRGSLRIVVITTMIILVVMFLAGLQPQVELAETGVRLGIGFAWRAVNVGFILILGSWLLSLSEKAVQLGRITPKLQLMLGVPPSPAQGIRTHIRQFVILMVVSSVAYGGAVVLVGDDGVDKLFNLSLNTNLLIGGIIVALICVGFLTGAIQIPQVLEDPIFAIGDAPSLRTHLKGALREVRCQ